MKKNYSQTARKQTRTIEDDLFITGCALLVMILTASALSFFQPGFWNQLKIPPCLFHAFTGYYCPGCGGTRAVRSLLHGHFLKSFYYHPFVPYAAAVYVCFMATQTASRISRGKFSAAMHYHTYYVWIAVAVIICNFILKNYLHYYYGFIL